jgi:hypothetical protein
VTAPPRDPGQDGTTPGRVHDQRTCPECQAMIKRGGHRIIDLLGHAGYEAYRAAQPRLFTAAWSDSREAWAQAAVAIGGEWTVCDSFEDWMQAKGNPPEGDYAEYGHSAMFEAFMAGAEIAARTPIAPQPDLLALLDHETRLTWDTGLPRRAGTRREGTGTGRGAVSETTAGQAGLADAWDALALKCDKAAQLPGLAKAAALEQSTFARQLRDCARQLRVAIAAQPQPAPGLLDPLHALAAKWDANAARNQRNGQSLLDQGDEYGSEGLSVAEALGACVVDLRAVLADYPDTAQPQSAPERGHVGTIENTETGTTWVSWDRRMTPAWPEIASAVSRLSGGTVLIREGVDVDESEEPDRAYVVIDRNLAEPQPAPAESARPGQAACDAFYGYFGTDSSSAVPEIDEQHRPAWEAAAQAVLKTGVCPHGDLRELLDEIGVMAANAPEDGDSFAVLMEIAMRIAAHDVEAS